MNAILDASALLAYLHQEPGWEVVREHIDGGCISSVNWCEVAQKATRCGLDVTQVRKLLEDIGLAIISFSPHQAELAALLWQGTRDHGLSLADRACLALALEYKIPVYTADRVWLALELDLDVCVIR